MKLLHISDWHTDAISAAIKLANHVPDLNYQAILITGDMWEDQGPKWQKSQWPPFIKAIKKAWPKRPIVVVYGNHDEYTGPIRGAKVFRNGAGQFTANGVRFAGLGVPVVKRTTNIFPKMGWFEEQLEKLDPTIDAFLCHYPPEYMPYVKSWVEARNVGVYCCGHYHSDFGISRNSLTLYSNASTAYTVIDVY